MPKPYIKNLFTIITDDIQEGMIFLKETTYRDKMLDKMQYFIETKTKIFVMRCAIW